MRLLFIYSSRLTRLQATRHIRLCSIRLREYSMGPCLNLAEAKPLTLAGASPPPFEPHSHLPTDRRTAYGLSDSAINKGERS